MDDTAYPQPTEFRSDEDLEGIWQRFAAAVRDQDAPYDIKRVIYLYQSADAAERALIDDIFISLTGWTFRTIMKGKPSDVV